MSDAKRTLDVRDKQKVSYCIPTWLRDEQILRSTRRVVGRLDGDYPERPEPIALVCYGPSLADTWEKIRDFEYVMTCSGSHRFLIDRGIVPKWHVEVDPRAHKVELLGEPHRDVEYLVASACHPKYFDHLEKAGAKVKLWHVFTTEEDSFRALPAGEWALTGGSSVGLRTMVLASFLGFRDFHIFGMDGTRGTTGLHAGSHPNQAPDELLSEVEYDGKTYRTTPGFLESARTTFYELDQLPGVRATFYGEGLVQSMAKEWTPKPKDGRKQKFIGVRKPVLITDEYRSLSAQLHESNLAYGVGGGRHADMVVQLAKALKTTSVLDYGAGKGYLAKNLPFPIWEYDPAFPDKATSPRPADIVVCTDVLEHVEPDLLLHVLGDLQRCVRKVGYFVIHCGPSKKFLADGRNAHLIQKPPPWWGKRLAAFFEVGRLTYANPLLHAVVGPLPAPKTKVSEGKQEKVNA